MTVQAAQPYQQNSSDTTFGLGLGHLTGNTLYHISSYDATGGIESELEFPLKMFLFGIEGTYNSKNRKGQDEFRLSFQWMMNLGEGSGQLKDSDWISGTAETSPPPNGLGFPAHPGLDIFSTSDISSKANIIEVKAVFNNWLSDTVSFGPLAGLLYQKFQFDASNVQQVGYGPYAATYTGSVSGLVLAYEVTYSIPYFGVHSEMKFAEGFKATVDLSYSPWASAEDRDYHLLRMKVSQASTSGSAYLAAAAAQWNLQNNNNFQVRGQYLKIDTSGTQTQTFYDGSGMTITGINDNITSEQTSLTFLFSHRF